MKLIRLTIFILLVTFGPAVLAQRPRYQPSIGAPCDLNGPLTKLEQFDSQWETVIVRGSTHIPGVIGNGGVHVNAIELREDGTAARALGVVIELRDAARQDATHPDVESKSYIDYEDIDAVLKAWDRVARADDTVTKLNNFQLSYRTKGNLEIAVFRQTPGGAIAAAVSGGCDQATVFLSLDEFMKLRWMISQAKAKLDELK